MWVAVADAQNKWLNTCLSNISFGELYWYEANPEHTTKSQSYINKLIQQLDIDPDILKNELKDVQNNVFLVLKIIKVPSCANSDMLKNRRHFGSETLVTVQHNNIPQ